MYSVGNFLTSVADYNGIHRSHDNNNAAAGLLRRAATSGQHRTWSTDEQAAAADAEPATRQLRQRPPQPGVDHTLAADQQDAQRHEEGQSECVQAEPWHVDLDALERLRVRPEADAARHKQVGRQAGKDIPLRPID